MDTEILNKPVNMQNLSHALAKVQADYVSRIKYVDDSLSSISVENSDWEETDTTDNAYILNKPAIKAGEGENSVLIGQTEQEENAQIFTLYLTGAGKATTFSYTTEDDLSGITVASFKMYGILFTGSTVPYRYITDIDTTQKTISVNSQISSSAITNQKMLLYYFYKLSNDDSVAEGIRTKAVGTHSHAEGANSIAIASSSHSEGNNTKAVGVVSHAEGNSSIASGIGSHAENSHTVASGSYSHAENYYTVASGDSSHAEGNYTTASGEESHSEGFQSYASGRGSHSEGGYGKWSNVQITGDSGAVEYTLTNPINIRNGLTTDDIIKSASIMRSNNRILKVINATVENNKIIKFTLDSTLSSTDAINETVSFLFGNVAKGFGSHAEGEAVFAQGNGSHAEGLATQAQGIASHAEGRATISQSDYSHAEGKFNIGGDYLHVAGNGTDGDNLSNAYTLDWQGNGWYAGKLTVGTNPTENMDVATKQYVDAATAGITTNLSGLADTTISSPTNGQILVYDNTTDKWINDDLILYGTVTISGSTATFSSNITGSSLLNKPVLIENNDSGDLYKLTSISRDRYLDAVFISVKDNNIKKIEVTGASVTGTTALVGVYSSVEYLDKANITSYTPTGDYNPATKKYVDDAVNGIMTNLSGLTDTTISSPINGQILVYDSASSKWINSTASFVSSSEVNTIVQTAVASALANYGDGDTATYGYVNVNEEEY